MPPEEEFPIIRCPHCKRGSGELTLRALDAGEWGHTICLYCAEEFEVGRAIDEMFLDGNPGGYALWAGYKIVRTNHELKHGETHIAEVRGEFESSYDVAEIQWGPVNGGSWLAGGAVAKYIPQGYMMMALAPWEERADRELEFIVRTVGRAPDGPELPAWRQTLLEGRILGDKAPAMAPILAVAGLDLFVESFADDEDYTLQDEDEPRPGCWRTALGRFTGLNLQAVEGGTLRRPQTLAEIRNKVAHGRNYLLALPDHVRADEETWQKDKHQFEKDSRLTPAGKYSMRIALEVIRNCLRELF